MGEDQYPKTIVDSNSIPNNHRFDLAYAAQLKKRKGKEKALKDKDKDEQEAPKILFAQMEGRCYCCGKPYHKSPNCHHKKNKPKNEWAINKTREIIQAQSRVTAASTITPDDTASIAMQPVQTSTDTNVVQATSPLFSWMA